MSSNNFATLDDNMSFKKPGPSKRGVTIAAIIAVAIIVALIIVIIVIAPKGDTPSASDGTGSQVRVIRWCTVNDEEQAKCLKMLSAFQQGGFFPVIECVDEVSTDECVDAIENGNADAMTVDGGHIFNGRDKLKPVMAEDYGNGDATYWAVAVVKKSDKTIALTSTGLKGKKSCHTGYQKSAGWNMPMGTLKSLGVISGCNIASGALNVFGEICAPGGEGDLCRGCSGSCLKSCDGENYCGYTGAFRCMVESGDVAFVKHTTVYANTDGNNMDSWARNLVSSDYELLCKGGTRAPLSDYGTCNMGRVPSHAVVVSAKASPNLVTSVVELLHTAQLRFGPHTDGSFKLFSGSSRDLLFKSSTRLLLPLTSSCTAQQFLGTSYLTNLYELQCEKLPSLPPVTSCVLPQYTMDTSTVLRWCVTSSAEMSKCENVTKQAQLLGSSLTVTCVLADDVPTCAAMIGEKTADVVSMDGGHIYDAGRQYNLQPVAAEFYGSSAGSESTTSYYAVAVINSSDTETRLTKAGLQGKKTCHTGYGRTAGWNVPIGFLLSNNIITSSSCDIPSQVSTFFSGSCVPGIKSTSESEAVKTKLCSACSGTGDDNCAASAEPYSGYSGALQCLTDGAGDVAFVKHSTVLASGIDQSQYKLLCPNGTTASPADYENCNIEQVPSHAFMISPHHSDIYREKVWALLNQLQNLDNFDLFSSPGGKDFLFKDSTKCLWKVDGSCGWAEFLGQTYINSTRAIKCRNDDSIVAAGQCMQVPTCTQ